jgi:hypothetical protein
MNNEQPSFHNTIHLKGDDLNTADGQCKLQEDLVKQVFVFACGKGFTPSEIQGLTGIKLITSVRRCMTDLSGGDNPFLIKTSAQRGGPHGLPEYVWITASEYKEDKTLFDLE